MKTQTFSTNLRCSSCLTMIKPLLDSEKSIVEWSVDLEDPKKGLSVIGDGVDPSLIKNLLNKAGYHQANENDQPLKTVTEEASPATYFPLILVLAYLIGGVSIFQFQAPILDLKEAMSQFMGGFFIVFSFFKILNLKGFAEAYATYDVVAKRWILYGYVYPFIELALGIAYWTQSSERLVNIATIIVMGVSSLGVIKSLMEKKRIKCACLGTVFNLPMTSITLLEDLLMVIMAGIMLGFAH